LRNGSTLEFWTRTIEGSTYPDRLELRLSTNGASTNVGSGINDAGDFSNLLLSINPDLQTGGYPDTGWTMYAVTLSGLPDAGVNGRIAFRYYVTNAGSKGSNSNYIGVDDFKYTASTLPVTFLSFNGMVKNAEALLNWATATEINNKGFEIEKSLDNQHFSTIGFVAGKGNTSSNAYYNFTDIKLVSGANFYRLKQIDMDGRFTYSSVIKLDYKNFAWQITGNPSANNAWVILQLDKPAKVSLQIVSLSGHVVSTINKGSLQNGTYSIPLNTHNYSAGMYIVRLLVDENIYSKKIIR